MNSDKTAIFGGLLILIGGLALAVYANTNATALSQSKAKAVDRYISLSEKALSEGKNRDAEKFVIKALKVDPSNKNALTAFKKVEFAGYKPIDATGGEPSNKTVEPKATPMKPAPAEEAEEEMGCI